MKELTGKASEDFFEWLAKTNDYYGLNEHEEVELLDCDKSWLDTLPQSAQFGLIQEWGDSVDIYIKASKSLSGYSYNVTRTLKHFQSFRSDTLQEAQREAVKKLSEIYNK